jgi:outer membrane protein TolC
LALRALADVEDALAAAQALGEREDVLLRVLADSERALVLVNTNYSVGSEDLRSVQQQQLAVHTARLVLLRVQGEQLSQRVNLHLALGGSFESPTPAQVSAADLPTDKRSSLTAGRP